MTVNTQQLLASVVAKPKGSSVDAKFMAAIWESFTTWMTEQLHGKTPFRCLDLGDFTLRRDKIGPMEFFNPMFVMNEGFAHRYGLHDRRPKPAALDSRTGRPLDVDMGKVTQMTTERLGEVVLRETVEAALKDVLERLGEFCADDRTHGIVTIDLLFGKLVCENRSVEFHFLTRDEREKVLEGRKRRMGVGAAGNSPGKASVSGAVAKPTDANGELGIVGASATGAGGRPSTALSGLSGTGTRPQTSGGGRARPAAVGASARPPTSGGLSSLAALPDPPLQRPRRDHVRRAPVIHQRDVLLSHAEQLARKAEALRQQNAAEAEAFSSDMSRLRGEMVLELEERVQRRAHMRDVALIHQVQAHEKALRDREARQAGSAAAFFPFRTEEELAAHNRASNALLKKNLDGQLREREEARRSLAAVLGKGGTSLGGSVYSASSRGGSEYGGGASSGRVGGAASHYGRSGLPPGPPESTSLPMSLPEPPRPAGPAAERPHVAMAAAIDDAYNRYAAFLKARAGAEERARGYAEEQALLAEQAELLRREESLRRSTEMGDYLKRQIEQKELREKQVALERRAYKPPAHLAVLPGPKPRDVAQEDATRAHLRKTLDHQIAAKARAKAAKESEEVAAQAEILQLVSTQLREGRQRDLARKAEEQAVLREAWDRQKALKELEKVVVTS